MAAKSLILPKIVFEVRYKQGYRYLDRCGEMMIEIENKLKNWSAREATITGCQMENQSEKMIFNCSSVKLDLAQYDNKTLDTASFLTCSTAMVDIVSKNLGIKDYVRFGLRYWFFYPIDSMKTGRKILSTNKFLNVSSEVESMFNKKIKDRSFVVILEEEGFGHRIALSLVHKEGVDVEKEPEAFLTTAPHKLPKGQKEALLAQIEKRKLQAERPDVAILLDIDNYRMNPKMEDLEGFIKTSQELSQKSVLSLIEGK
jgi:hypothetical protein